MREKIVRLEQYTDRWPARYGRIKRRLERGLSDFVPRVEHIGSTAVPGLLAKPTIDVAVGLESLDAAQRAVPLLEALGYEHVPEFSERNPDALYLIRGPLDFRSEHIFLLEGDGLMWHRYLSFRDYIRRHPEIRSEYETLKRALAARYPNDRPSYTASKADFIERVVRLAMQQPVGEALDAT